MNLLNKKVKMKRTIDVTSKLLSIDRLACPIDKSKSAQLTLLLSKKRFTIEN